MDTWGLIPKNQTDPETIEEAINRITQSHDDDPESHLDPGQALTSHRAQEIIDHIARSVVRDKLAFERFQIEVYFESLDGWTYSSRVFLNQISLVELDTTNVSNNEQWLYCSASDANENGANPMGNPFFQTSVKLSHNTLQTCYIISGDPLIPAGYGFKISNGSLYSWYIDTGDVERTSLITGINLLNWNQYKVEVTGGSEIKFYINQTLAYTATLNIPTNPVSSFIMYRIKTSTAAIRKMFVQYLIYDEDRFD
jgi:hypothetical protein